MKGIVDLTQMSDSEEDKCEEIEVVSSSDPPKKAGPKHYWTCLNEEPLELDDDRKFSSTSGTETNNEKNTNTKKKKGPKHYWTLLNEEPLELDDDGKFASTSSTEKKNKCQKKERSKALLDVEQRAIGT